jgi:RimJ/RimL family protein N-acetyltransferase
MSPNPPAAPPPFRPASAPAASGQDRIPEWRIARLSRGDADQYRPLRLEALRLHPCAFASDVAEESQMGPETFAARIAQPPGAVFGGFAPDGQGGERLVGALTLAVQSRPKLRHRGDLYGMYVAPPYRRSGLARGLVEAATRHAREVDLRVVLLAVTSGNHAARQLYAALGFRPCGIEPRALCVDGMLYDVELMALLVDPS